MALIDLLHRTLELHRLDLVVAHFDHGIHPASAAVAERVRTSAAAYRLAYEEGGAPWARRRARRRRARLGTPGSSRSDRGWVRPSWSRLITRMTRWRPCSCERFVGRARRGWRGSPRAAAHWYARCYRSGARRWCGTSRSATCPCGTTLPTRILATSAGGFAAMCSRSFGRWCRTSTHPCSPWGDTPPVIATPGTRSWTSCRASISGGSARGFPLLPVRSAGMIQPWERPS